MITPTVGRLVYFFEHPPGADRSRIEPQAALIVAVLPDLSVNVNVFGPHGGPPLFRASVALIQPGEQPPAEPYYCEWMPYQAQKAKAEAEKGIVAA